MKPTFVLRLPALGDDFLTLGRGGPRHCLPFPHGGAPRPVSESLLEEGVPSSLWSWGLFPTGSRTVLAGRCPAKGTGRLS